MQPRADQRVRDATPPGSGRGPGGARPTRWAWTHRYAAPLLMAAVVAVVLSGGGLVAAVLVFGGGGPSGTLNPAGTASPTPTERPGPCEVGTWRAVALEDVAVTGTWTLIAGSPTFEFREDGTGVIDYGDRTEGNTTTYGWVDVFGSESTSTPHGQRDFRYVVADGEIRFEYLNLLSGATMLRIPYIPNEHRFTADCQGNTMILDGNRGYIELEWLPS